MVHNHELLLEDGVHKLRSHKKLEKVHVEYFQKMRRNGMNVSHAYRLLRNNVHQYSGFMYGMSTIVLQMKSKGLQIGC